MKPDLDTYLTSPSARRQTATQDATSLHPGDGINGLTAISLLGRGATGEVWRVRDTGLRADLALKLCTSDDPTARERFLVEARLLAQFNHRNLVRVHCFGTHLGRPYFTMDLLRPLPIDADERRIGNWLANLSDALTELHSRGIIHRDIKIDNVLLGNQGEAVLTDLGIAHLADADFARQLQNASAHNLTFAGGDHALGTPGYAAPEQLAGAEVSPATDIHALGMLAFELFRHRPPRDWLPVLRQATCADPALRFATAASFKRHLRRIRCRRTVRRLAAAFALVLASVVVILAFLPKERPWTEMPESCYHVDKQKNAIFINLPRNARYYQTKLSFPFKTERELDLSILTNEFRRRYSSPVQLVWRRVPVFISGEGELNIDKIVGGEIHLASGVTFSTSGLYDPDGFHIPHPTPPEWVTFSNGIFYTTYVVAPGARLVFTENKNYPQRLIQRLEKE